MSEVKTIEDMIAALRDAPKLDQWIIIDPRGRVYQGDIGLMTRVLAANHPLLKYSERFRDE